MGATIKMQAQKKRSEIPPGPLKKRSEFTRLSFL